MTECRAPLMQRAFGVGAALSQLFDLVLEEKLPALQCDDVKIVGGRMKCPGFDFPLESFVTALEFCKMVLH